MLDIVERPRGRGEQEDDRCEESHCCFRSRARNWTARHFPEHRPCAAFREGNARVIWFVVLGSVLLTALASVVAAGAIALGLRFSQAISKPLVAFAVGALLGDAFFHLLP